MTNIFIEEINFLTLEEVKKSSKFLSVLSDDEIKIFVSKAEKIVKGIIGRDFEEEIPINIKQATILLTECIFENKDKIKGRIIKSETRRGNQVVFATENEDFSLKKIHPCLNNDIYFLLKDFINPNKKIGSSFFRT